MKLFIAFLLLCLTHVVYGQSSVSIDSSRTMTDEVSIAYNVNTDLNNLEELSIEQFYIDSLDTISIYFGSYNLEEDDASDFMKTHFDFPNNQIKFWIGEFEPSIFYAKIVFVRQDGSEEIINL